MITILFYVFTALSCILMVATFLGSIFVAKNYRGKIKQAHVRLLALSSIIFYILSFILLPQNPILSILPAKIGILGSLFGMFSFMLCDELCKDGSLKKFWFIVYIAFVFAFCFVQAYVAYCFFCMTANQ